VTCVHLSCAGQHEGEAVRVHVTARANRYDWGEAWYCQKAIRFARSIGFEVVEANR